MAFKVSRPDKDLEKYDRLDKEQKEYFLQCARDAMKALIHVKFETPDWVARMARRYAEAMVKEMMG